MFIYWKYIMCFQSISTGNTLCISSGKTSKRNTKYISHGNTLLELLYLGIIMCVSSGYVIERSYLIFSFPSYLITPSYLWSYLIKPHGRHTLLHITTPSTAHHCTILRLTHNTCYTIRFTHVTPPDTCMPFTIYSVFIAYL